MGASPLLPVRRVMTEGNHGRDLFPHRYPTARRCPLTRTVMRRGRE